MASSDREDEEWTEEESDYAPRLLSAHSRKIRSNSAPKKKETRSKLKEKHIKRDPRYHRLLKSREHQYQYEPLDQSSDSVRLLQIKPAISDRDPIECSLYKSEIASSSYKCLSYQWGPKGRGDFIIINGKAHFVRWNLLNFLLRMRKKHCAELFWIDALSIDQRNVSERNHQVQLMGKIYRSAVEVCVWLGDTSKDGIIAAIQPRFWDTPSNDPLIVDYPLALTASRAGPATWPDFARRSSEVTDPEEDESAIYGIEMNSLWERAWITQEIALARQLRLMRRMTEMDHDTILAQDPHGSFGRIPLWNKSGRVLPGIDSLLLLLCRFQHQKCSVQRDRVFSLHTLCIEGPRITVDYQLSDDDFLEHVLSACADRLCLCSPTIVATALQTERAPESFVTMHATRSSFSGKWGAQHRCQKCGLTTGHTGETTGYLICLADLCPTLGKHFFLQQTEHAIEFKILGPKHRHIEYYARIEGPIAQLLDSAIEQITLRLPLQVLIDLDHSRGILYYNEQHLNQRKAFIQFERASLDTAAGSTLMVKVFARPSFEFEWCTPSS